MRLEFDGPYVKVALSRRNLLTLLAKLNDHPEASEGTILYYDGMGSWLMVTAEEDGPHYANPERDDPRPGEMHPETERAIDIRIDPDIPEWKGPIP